MKITALFKVIPPEMENRVRARSSRNMQDAANALEWHLYEGLSAQVRDPIRILNLLPIGSYPRYYRDPFIKTETFATRERGDHLNIGFCNVKLIRKFQMERAVYKALKKHYQNDPDPGVLLIYSAAAAFMRAGMKIKKRVPKLKTCVVIADLPELSNLTSRKSLLLKWFEKYQSQKSKKAMDAVDSFVLLTEQMADYLHINQPYCVVEGIATETQSIEHLETREKNIVYTGTLHRKFGILTLLEAFRMLDDPDYRLIICGMGDSEKEIKAAAEQDSRIQFMGQLPREEVLKIQAKATVLVNPRPNDEEFTQYSFPSKTMEYLSSGVPVVAYKLDGMPEEYCEYLRIPHGNSPKDMGDALKEVCQMTEEQLREAGDKGRTFVMREKNAIEQTKKILRMLNC